MDKIQTLEIEGRSYQLELFPENVKQLVAGYEIVRKQYNESAVTTAALGQYMNKTIGDIDAAAKAALEEMLGGKSTSSAKTEDVVTTDADDNK